MLEDEGDTSADTRRHRVLYVRRHVEAACRPQAPRHTSTLPSRSVTRIWSVLHPWPFCPGDNEPVHKVAVASPGGHRHHRGFGEQEAGGRTDRRTLVSSVESYPQLFAESLSTFGSEAIHKAILSEINRRAYQWQLRTCCLTTLCLQHRSYDV